MAFDPTFNYLNALSQHSITSAYPRTNVNGVPAFSDESNTLLSDFNLPV